MGLIHKSNCVKRKLVFVPVKGELKAKITYYFLKAKGMNINVFKTLLLYLLACFPR